MDFLWKGWDDGVKWNIITHDLSELYVKYDLSFEWIEIISERMLNLSKAWMFKNAQGAADVISFLERIE